MREKFIIWPEADADIAEAYVWYEERAGKALDISFAPPGLTQNLLGAFPVVPLLRRCTTG